MDINGNHFMRKFINLLPFFYNKILIQKVLDNFMELVNNKNSVCVLKVILRIIAKEQPS